MLRFSFVLGILLLAAPALAGNRCNVSVQSFALQSGLAVTPFAVPVATPVATVAVGAYSYGFTGQAAQSVSAASVDSQVDKIADRVIAKLRAAGFGGIKAEALPEKPSLVSANCAACHGATKQAGGFRVDLSLSPEAKLKAIGRILADDPAKRMPKGKNLDPQTLGLLLQELAGKPSVPEPPAPVAEPGPAKE